MATESKLWQAVNALGGVPANEYDRGFNAAVRQVLTLIEDDGSALTKDALAPHEAYIGLIEANGGPAFPTRFEMPDGGTYQSPGMTPRDHFAGQAMAAIVTTDRAVFTEQFVPWARYAEEAYKLADAMLAERSKP